MLKTFRERLQVCKKVWKISTTAIVIQSPRKDSRHIFTQELIFELITHCNVQTAHFLQSVISYCIGTVHTSCGFFSHYRDSAEHPGIYRRLALVNRVKYSASYRKQKREGFVCVRPHHLLVLLPSPIGIAAFCLVHCRNLLGGYSEPTRWSMCLTRRSRRVPTAGTHNFNTRGRPPRSVMRF